MNKRLLLFSFSLSPRVGTRVTSVGSHYTTGHLVEGLCTEEREPPGSCVFWCQSHERPISLLLQSAHLALKAGSPSISNPMKRQKVRTELRRQAYEQCLASFEVRESLPVCVKHIAQATVHGSYGDRLVIQWNPHVNQSVNTIPKPVNEWRCRQFGAQAVPLWPKNVNMGRVEC